MRLVARHQTGILFVVSYLTRPLRPQPKRDVNREAALVKGLGIEGQGENGDTEREDEIS